MTYTEINGQSYPTTRHCMVNELEELGYARAHIFQAIEWCTNNPNVLEGGATAKLRNNVLQFLVDNNAPTR